MFPRPHLHALIALLAAANPACGGQSSTEDPGTPGNPRGGDNPGSNDPDDGANNPGGTTCTGNCSPEALRLTKLALKDPHVYLSGCVDITGSGLISVNDLIADAIGKGDVNVLMMLAPYGADSGSGSLDVADQADCDSRQNPTSCAPKSLIASDLTTTATASGGSCFSADPATLNESYQAPKSASAPCFASRDASLTITVAGLKIPLAKAKVAATFATGASPGLVNGVLSGFLSLTEAAKVVMPATTPVVGGDQLTEHLAEGTSTSGCATVNDTDTAEINGASVRGYWFYFDFEAAPVGLSAGT